MSVMDLGDSEYYVKICKQAKKGVHLKVMRSGQFRTGDYFNPEPPAWAAKKLKSYLTQKERPKVNP